jgi:hypothetical protein
MESHTRCNRNRFFYPSEITAGTLYMLFMCAASLKFDGLFLDIISNSHTIEGTAIPVTGRGGPWRCETLRLPHFLDNMLTDGDEVVSLMHRPTALYPQEFPHTPFC